MLEKRYHLQEFPALFLVSCCAARISDRRVRAVRKMYELLKLFTQSKLGDTDSTGDAEMYKRESETDIFAAALFALLAMLLWSLMAKVWFE